MDTNDMIFVFGSNEAGIHGAGAAAYAHKYKGAQFGIATGRTGQAYAIPTKDAEIRLTLPLILIEAYVDRFIEYAKAHPEMKFQVTAIGCGLAGLKHGEIAPMFNLAPLNCYFDTVWYDYLSKPMKQFWGTF